MDILDRPAMHNGFRSPRSVSTTAQRRSARSARNASRNSGSMVTLTARASAAMVSRFALPRTDPDGTKRAHLGADLMFQRRDARDLIAVYPPQTANGTKRFFMPDGVPALAASAGTIRLAEWTAVGYTASALVAAGVRRGSETERKYPGGP